jgi:hypothetical protein
MPGDADKFPELFMRGILTKFPTPVLYSRIFLLLALFTCTHQLLDAQETPYFPAGHCHTLVERDTLTCGYYSGGIPHNFTCP